MSLYNRARLGLVVLSALALWLMVLPILRLMWHMHSAAH